MRAKRQILSLLLVLLLVWQGFSFANAETGSTQGIVGSGTGTEASAAKQYNFRNRHCKQQYDFRSKQRKQNRKSN